MLSRPEEQIATLRQGALALVTCGSGAELKPTQKGKAGRVRHPDHGWGDSEPGRRTGSWLGCSGHQVWAGVALSWVGGHVWCHWADDLITGGLCRWALASLPGSSNQPCRRLHGCTPPPPALAPSNLQPSMGKCEEGWGLLATGPGNSAGVAVGCGRGGSIPGRAWGTPAVPGPCQPLEEGILGVVLGWHPGRGGAGAGGFVCCRPSSLPGPPPDRSCQSLRK